MECTHWHWNGKHVALEFGTRGEMLGTSQGTFEGLDSRKAGKVVLSAPGQIGKDVPGDYPPTVEAVGSLVPGKFLPKECLLNMQAKSCPTNVPLEALLTLHLAVLAVPFFHLATRNTSPFPHRLLVKQQEYIANPLLLHGFKFDLRLYVVVTSFRPLRVYLYRDAIVRLCAVKYEAGTALSEGLQVWKHSQPV